MADKIIAATQTVLAMNLSALELYEVSKCLRVRAMTAAENEKVDIYDQGEVVIKGTP